MANNLNDLVKGSLKSSYCHERILYAQETGRLLAITTHPFLAGAVLAVVVAIAKEISSCTQVSFCRFSPWQSTIRPHKC